MAKAKNSFHLQRFLFIFATILSITALGVVVYASQQTTNTESDAAVTCKKKPKIEYKGVNKMTKTYVEYVFKLSNPNPARCKDILYEFYIETPTSNWIVYYTKASRENWDTHFSGILGYDKSVTVRAEISAPPKAAKRTYDLRARACEGFSVEGEIMAGPNLNCNNYTVKYVKD